MLFFFTSSSEEIQVKLYFHKTQLLKGVSYFHILKMQHFALDCKTVTVALESDQSFH